ncbi:MAG: hypothetical protein M3460_21165 [Actinomycetota bacterium]|nr:hypothetical protein [Actinomycetota bacterium]
MVGSGLLPRTRLEQLVRQSRRTRAEFHKDFVRASDQLDEGLTVSVRQVGRWMAGNLDGLPHPAACRVLEQMFAESAERLFGPPDLTSRAEVATVEVPGPVPVGGSRVEDLAVQREVAMAAAESAHFGQFAEQSNVGPHTLEQFRAIEARAHARLRDQRATENALARAEQAREEVRGVDDPGGMLTFPLAKQTLYTATAQLWLGGQDSYTDAERDATHAVELYEADPLEQRRLGELCLARLDLAAARLGRDDLDGAAEQLQGVLAIATQRRIEPVARRLNQVGRALQRPRYQTSALALDLHDQIRSFTRVSSPPTLPGADG